MTGNSSKLTNHGRLSRRGFIQSLGAGIVIVVGGGGSALAQATGEGTSQRRYRPNGAAAAVESISSRFHVGNDGIITVLTGKVECGQGARAELTQAAAEELCCAVESIRLIMADTGIVPDDGGTFGSRTTPATVPVIRQGAAAVRNVLVSIASQKWEVPRTQIQTQGGKLIHEASQREISYGDLVGETSSAVFAQTQPTQIAVTAVKNWKILGTPVPRPNRRELVTGTHVYPSDVTLPGMLYGKVLRAPSYGAKLTSIDLAPAKAMQDVIVVRDGDFVGVAAPTSFAAAQAIEALGKTAAWQTKDQISSKDLFEHLRQQVIGGEPPNPFADDLKGAAKSVRQVYNVSYIQHAPMEPRAACAEWENGRVTVWTGTQNPFSVKTELERQLQLSPGGARVVVPDFGGGFGGKHTGECAVEAARLARAAESPVSLRWTREEEFTWAYFRPAGVIVAEAGLDSSGAISSWYFLNINSGPQGVNTPYQVGKHQEKTVASQPPLRHGSYRGLASTANHFARESFMDELAEAAKVDPLAFRLAHLQDQRLRAVLQTAAEKFDFVNRYKQSPKNIGVGLACGVEKGSYVAACAEVFIDKDRTIAVRHVCQAFECGAIMNPANLQAQVQGAIMMGLGPTLREAVEFEKGRVTNANFADYEVPRFADLPELDVHLINRTDLPSAGAGETPIIAIAPAVANAVFHATGIRVRQMPLKLPAV